MKPPLAVDVTAESSPPRTRRHPRAPSSATPIPQVHGGGKGIPVRMMGKPWEPQVTRRAQANHPLMPIGCPSGPLPFNRGARLGGQRAGRARRGTWRPWVGSGTDKPVTVNCSHGSQSPTNPCTVAPGMLSHLYGDDTARTLGLVGGGTRGCRTQRRGAVSRPNPRRDPSLRGEPDSLTEYRTV